MPLPIMYPTPSLSTFLKSLKTNDIETSVELFVALLKRRQIRNSRPCAIATAQLLLHVVAQDRTRDAQTLINRVREVGRRLVAAQPRELAVGNVIRRVLGVVREVTERDQDQSVLSDGSVTPSSSTLKESSRSFGRISELGSPHSSSLHVSALQGTFPTTSLGVSSSDGMQSPVQRPGLPGSTTSLFNILQTPMGTPPLGTTSPANRLSTRKDIVEPAERLDIKAEVIDGIKELLDELEIVDTQIAEYALDHIHSNEIILTHTSSQTVQKFLMNAARKRKFTVIHAEAYPNDHEDTHDVIVNGGKKSTQEAEDDGDDRWKPLTTMGITVILIPDSAVFALMSRINKVILAPHTVLANGSLLAAAGAATIAAVAHSHHVPVVVLSGVYKLSPVYPFDTEEVIEYGDPSRVVPFHDGDFMDNVDIVNPLYDWVSADMVDLYITNLGGCAPSFLYRIVADHYRSEDVDLTATKLAMASTKAK
nr:putative translation initiation factor eif-2b subunit beta [Quercus suber]